jgi:hypothetical protein
LKELHPPRTDWQLARNLKKEVTKILNKPLFERNQRSRETWLTRRRRCGEISPKDSAGGAQGSLRGF